MTASTQASTTAHINGDDSVPLGNNIYLFEPTKGDKSRNTDHSDGSPPAPSLIILCTWLGGATTARVAKYTSWYRKQHPNVHLLLIRTVFLDLSARSVATIRTRLKPARDAIIRILQHPNSPEVQRHEDYPVSAALPGVLLHIFSHGGCNTAIQLAISLHEDEGTLLRDRIHQIVFDSCPGDDTFEKAYNAAMVSLPPALSGNIFGAAAAYSAVTIITALPSVGLMSSVVDMRQNLNDPALFGTHARRLYLVSRCDRMVAVEDVLSHAQAAEAAGYEVGLVVFNEAPHCGLIMEDAERYWRAIQDCWDGKELSAVPGQDQANDRPRL